MDGKELQKHFRAAAWDTPESLEMFLLAADDAGAQEVAKLIPLLVDRTLAADARGHKLRCEAFARLVQGTPDPVLFVPLVRLLKTTADVQLRGLVVGLLPKINHIAGHAELVAVLRSQDVVLRRQVASVLRQLGGKAIFEGVSELARTPDSPARTEAIELAGSIGGHHAVPVLARVLEDGKPGDKLVALRFLGDARAMARDLPGALAACEKTLSDAAEQVALAAVQAFGALADEDAFYARLGAALDSPNVAVIRAVVEACRRFPSPRTIEALERKYRMGPNSVRFAVLATLEAIGDDSVLPVLAEALNGKHQTLRNRAAEVVSSLSVNRKVNLARTLMWLLRSRDVNVRRIAVDLAKRVGDPTGELWPSLLRFLRDEDWWVRERVTDALVEIAGTQLTRHIVGHAQDPSDVVRRYAVEVLLRLKDPASLGVLVRLATGDQDWWVRERSLEAIGSLKDVRAVPYVVDLMARQADLRLACLQCLLDLGEKTAAPQVALQLAAPEVDVKLAALACLDVLGGDPQGEAVAALLGDEDFKVRGAARKLLEKWEWQRKIDLTVQTSASTPVDRLLVMAARAEGDDLILSSARRPCIKRLGGVVPLTDEELGPDQVAAMLLPLLSESQRADIAALRDVDFSYEVKTEGLRFRANVFVQNDGLAAVFRIIKDRLLTFEQLGLPAIVRTFGDLKNGLVLVGGPTGSGKSTTLAAIIDHINFSSDRHIVTLEDPIEVQHVRKKSLVNQREIGTHTRSFAAALRSMLREDPDVILVGEMRDLATISFAVSAAETGHLVFGTLHTVSADTTVDRLINTFPGGQHAQVRSMLSESLRAVVCQQLVRRVDQPGSRVAALEIMVNNDAVSNLIRKGKCFQIPSIIVTGRDQGMQSMDVELKRMVKEGKIAPDEAYMKANNKKEFEEYFQERKPEAAQAPLVPAAPKAASASASAPAPPPASAPSSGLPSAPARAAPTPPAAPGRAPAPAAGGASPAARPSVAPPARPGMRPAGAGKA